VSSIAKPIHIAVHATPGARRNRVGGSHDGALRVSVTAPADKGRANQAIVQALAEALQCKASQITLIRGQTSRRKLFAIDASDDDFEARIEGLMNIR
jgi:uncharacterized protein